MERARDLIYRLDAEGRFIYANAATERLTGRSRDELLGTPLAELVREDRRPELEGALAKLVGGAPPPEYLELPIVTPGGVEVWLGQQLQRIVTEDGSVEVQGEGRDVARQRELRESLAASEVRLRAVVESLGEGLVVSDAEDRVLYVNPAFERITGYASEDLVGNRALDLMAEPTHGSARREGRAGAAELPELYETRIRHRAGHWIELRVIATPLRDAQGEPFAMLAAVTDITELRRADRAREESEENFRALAERIGEAFWISTADLGRALYLSSAYEEIIGKPREDLLLGRHSLLDLVHPEDRAAVREATALDRVLAEGFDVEFRVVRADGEIRRIRNRGFALRDPDGQGYRLAGLAQDVTERREAAGPMHDATYQSLYNSLTDLVYIQDLDGRFLNVNDAVLEAYGYSRDELLGASPGKLADPERVDMEELRRRVELAAAGQPQRFEFWGRRKDGSSFPKEVVLTRTEYFGHNAVMAVARDISERKRAQAESERLAALSRENPSPVLECDAAGRPVHVNPAAAEIARELGLDSVEGLLPQDHRDLVRQALERQRGFHGLETTAAGRIFEWSYRPHAASGVVHLFATEVTARRLMEEQLRHDALHDALTDLPNRLLFMERLEHVVQRARRKEGALFAVLFLDLDRFKIINDSLGHHLGDELLIAVADRLQASVRTEDTVARFGGDEFAILVESIGDISDATRVAERIHDALLPPVHLEGYDLVISASVGIALGSSGDDLPADLLRNADVAMYRAKSAGPAHYRVFDRGMHVAALGRLQTETELRQAVDREELVLQYQPVVELATGRVVSLEALVRWRHPERGQLLAGSFIPLAEETGMVRAIGGWVLGEACSQLVAWRRTHGAAAPATVAVNVSARQLVGDELLHQVEEALGSSGLPAECLVLDISERAIMGNIEGAVALLRRLSELGVRLCLDDFGTGYSSLSYLHRLSLHGVKIDGSFIARTAQEPGMLQLVTTMVTLARGLGAGSVAEAVETAEQLEALKGIGVGFAQGHYIAPPLDADEVDEYLARGD